MKNSMIAKAVSFMLAILTVLPTLAACKSEDGTSATTTAATTVAVPKKDPADSLYQGEQILLYDADTAPVIYVDADDYKQTVRAVGDLQEDFERVTDKKPALVHTAEELAGADVAVIVGTLGHSALIDSMEAAGIIGVDEIKGQWEAYSIAVVENPVEGVEKAVVIAGSDKRGTIYGAYELSEQIGVSPWYYWSDVEIEHRDTISLPVSELSQTEMPDVKYRGIFLNDEENFTEWSAQFADRNGPGKPGANVYAHVYELLLRLKANILWPGMHSASGTDAFNKYINPATGVSYNAELADEYGIVMSASHCEMLLRNNEGEWDAWCEENKGKYGLTKINNSWHSSYDYTVNAEAMNAYWEESVARNYRFENVYMIGLRGVHDSGINCSALSNPTYENKAKVVKQAVEAQLEILAKYEKKYEEETGEAIKFETAYCVYKEAAEYFKYDIGLPEDCCLMYAEDNHGYIRSTVSEDDLAKYEKFGMYYHVSYWGRPASYLWISNTPLTIIAEEMRKAYYTGTDYIWVLNVGDIKPAEFKVDYFMELGWDVDSHTEHNTEEYTVQFLQETFGLTTGDCEQFAATLTDFYQIMRNYYPEIIDKHTDKGSYVYSVVNFGSEGLIVLEKLTEIYEESLTIYNGLPEGKKASYYEIFHYTIYSYLLSVQKHVYKEMNNLCYEQGRYAAANAYADLSEAAYYQILAEIEYFNKELMDGKWNKIMNPYNSKMPQPEGAPDVKRTSMAQATGGAGLSAEGQSGLAAVTLKFGSLNDDIRFVDIFNKGTSDAGWALTVPAYVIVTDAKGNRLAGKASGADVVYEGTVGVEDRYFLSIDWEKFTAGETKTGTVTLTDDFGSSSTAGISATKHALDPETETVKGYYEENGLVSIEAEHYTENVKQGGFEWKYIDGLGRSGGVMMALSEENNGFENVRITKDLTTESPYLEYQIYFTNTGLYYGTFYRLPTLNESASGRSYCRTGWSLDGSEIKYLSGTTTADDADHSAWGNMIKLHIEELRMNIQIDEAGWHTLRIYMSNSLQAFDKIVFNQDALVESRLDAPETFNTVSWSHAPTANLPEIDFEDVSWDRYSALYDFNTTGGTLQSGYTKVDNTAGSLAENGWAWSAVTGISSAFRSSVSKCPDVDKGFVYGTDNVTFKLQLPGAGRYGITVAVGDPAGTVKAENMSINVGGKECLSGISSAKGVQHYFFIVEADESGVVEFALSGSWILSSLEVYSYAEQNAAGKGAFVANSDGNIVIETEIALEQSDTANATASTDGKGYRWTEVAGIYGSGMFFGPNTGSSYAETDASTSKSAKMNFTVEIPKAGSYTVWALIKCSSREDDLVIVSLPGKTSLVKNDLDITGYVWIQIGSFADVAAGETVLTVMGREDGFAVDRIMLIPAGGVMNYEGEMVRAD
ncbi:MAG: glycosyl hydrolase 115 family protein [Clostridia bacterium]|nr:glycosyl hydrolase 115 family protein [Clostridia bacterium]